jgi:hypothetical protein
MNANIKTMPVRIILAALLILTAVIGCTSKSTPLIVVYMPDRIIQDFSDMREHEIVSWAWIRRGFRLSNCRSFKLEPVMDSSQNPNPAVVSRIEQGLKSILEDSMNEKGDLELIVRANVLDVKVKPGRIKSWFADFDTMPYVEIEIIMTDRATGLPMAKIIHFRRNEKSLKTAVSDILGDLKLFFTTAI